MSIIFHQYLQILNHTKTATKKTFRSRHLPALPYHVGIVCSGYRGDFGIVASLWRFLMSNVLDRRNGREDVALNPMEQDQNADTLI